jgi:hypothetical protein
MFYSADRGRKIGWEKIINWGRPADIVGEGQWRCNYIDRGDKMARLSDEKKEK